VIDKAALLARRISKGEHEIEGVGTVSIRGLSRQEVLDLQKLDGVAAVDRRMVSLAMVDPALTEADVAEWQSNSCPLEIERLTEAIRDLSGLGAGASKSGVPGAGK